MPFVAAILNADVPKAVIAFTSAPFAINSSTKNRRKLELFKGSSTCHDWQTLLVGIMQLPKLPTLPTAEILSGKNARAWVSIVLYLKKQMKIKILKRKKKSWEPLRSCRQNSTANPANFHPNWAGLAVLFRRQLLNGSQDFFFVLII